MTLESLTYGTLPKKESILAAVNRLDGGFYWNLKGQAADTAERCGIDAVRAQFSPEEVVDLLRDLVRHWENGDDRAGDLASGTMLVLGWEWI